MSDPTTVELVALSLMALCLLSLIISWCVRFALTKKLRREYRTHWEELGRPQTFGPTLGSVMRILKFIWSTKMKELDSSGLQRLVLADRISLVVTLSLFVAFFIAYLLAVTGGV